MTFSLFLLAWLGENANDDDDADCKASLYSPSRGFNEIPVRTHTLTRTTPSPKDAPVIFMSAGFTSVSSSLFLSGLFGVVKLISALVFMFYSVKVRGNRFWLKLGCGVCAFSMLVLGMFMHGYTRPTDPLVFGIKQKKRKRGKEREETQ